MFLTSIENVLVWVKFSTTKTSLLKKKQKTTNENKIKKSPNQNT